jgi:phosphoserine phosphatase
LEDFMKNLTPVQNQFIESVLRLKPRIATFDCDGTLWAGDAGEGFFSWELEQGLVSEEVVRWARPRYADYRAGKVTEEVMCGEMVTMHRGLREEMVQQAATTYFEQHFAGRIFPEMQELISGLRESGCEVWAVSSTNLWVIAAAMKHFGIAAGRILAASVKVHDATITDRLIRVPSGPDKPKALRQVLTGTLDCAFGNSKWDREMLAMAKYGFAINPNPDLKETALARGWVVYQPGGDRGQQVTAF